MKIIKKKKKSDHNDKPWTYYCRWMQRCILRKPEIFTKNILKATRWEESIKCSNHMFMLEIQTTVVDAVNYQIFLITSILNSRPVSKWWFGLLCAWKDMLKISFLMIFGRYRTEKNCLIFGEKLCIQVWLWFLIFLFLGVLFSELINHPQHINERTRFGI